MGAALSDYIIGKAYNMNLNSGLVYERVALAMCLKTDDGQEGITALTEKRSPQFTAR